MRIHTCGQSMQHSCAVALCTPVFTAEFTDRCTRFRPSGLKMGLNALPSELQVSKRVQGLHISETLGGPNLAQLQGIVSTVLGQAVAMHRPMAAKQECSAVCCTIPIEKRNKQDQTCLVRAIASPHMRVPPSPASPPTSRATGTYHSWAGRL
jgi:hypothetical protein